MKTLWNVVVNELFILLYVTNLNCCMMSEKISNKEIYLYMPKKPIQLLFYGNNTLFFSLCNNSWNLRYSYFRHLKKMRLTNLTFFTFRFQLILFLNAPVIFRIPCICLLIYFPLSLYSTMFQDICIVVNNSIEFNF